MPIPHPTPRPGTQWSDIEDTLYLPGDLVRTKFGPALIREAHKTQGRDRYAVWVLPGWEWKPVWRKTESGEDRTQEPPLMWDSPKGAWYDTTELELVELGHASKIRQSLIPPASPQ
jgi:hypothetical protein